MTRLVRQAIEVSPAPGDGQAPQRFRWRGTWYRVQRLLDLWPEAGAWWDGEREVTFYRVLTAGGQVFELVRDHQGGWRLYRIYD